MSTRPSEIPPLPVAVSGSRYLWAAAAMALSGLCNYGPPALAVFRDALREYFDVDRTQYALLLSIGLLPGAVGGFLGGPLCNRRGPLWVLRAGLLLTALGMAAMAMASRQFAVMLGGTVVMWVGMGLVGTAVPAYLVRLFPDHQRRVLSLQLVAISLIAMCFPLLAEFLLRLHREGGAAFAQVLHIPMGAMAAVLLVGASLSGRLGAATMEHSASPTPVGRLAFGGLSLGAVVLIAVTALHCTCDNLIASWLPTVLDGMAKAPAWRAPGVVLAVGSFAYVISRIILSLLPEHVGRRALLVAPGLLGGGVLLCGLVSRDQAVLSFCYIGAMFLWSAEFPTLVATMSRGYGRQFSTIYAIMSLAQGTAYVLALLAIGRVGDALTPDRLWVTLLPPASGFLLVAAGGLLWLRIHRRETAAPPA